MASKKKTEQPKQEPKRTEIQRPTSENKVRVVATERELKCILTKEEWDARAEKSAFLEKQKTTEEESLASYAQSKKAVIKRIQGDISLLSQEIRDKAVYRTVECHEIHDIERKTVRVVRLDMKPGDQGYEVDVRRMTSDELQMNLALKESERRANEAAPPRKLTVVKSPEEAREELDAEGDRGAGELRAKSERANLPLLKQAREEREELEDSPDGVAIFSPDDDLDEGTDEGQDFDHDGDEEEADA
jgi:hypothetical protein